MTQKKYRSGMRTMCAAVALFSATTSFAQAEDWAAREFMSPARPLSDALLALSDQYEIALVAPQELLQGKTAPAIAGTYTSNDALVRMLRGTGLSYRRDSDGAVIITRQQRESAVQSGSGDPGVVPVSTGTNARRSSNVGRPIAQMAQADAPDAVSDAPGVSRPSQSAPLEEIMVTGSRIVRRDFMATSPIVTVDSDFIEMSSAVNLEANLNKLPQFTPALTQFDTQDLQANANNTIGVSTVSLRQLGSNRNLVLLDGRRPTPINGTGVVDINSIPSAAVQRVEIITGGASSTYGADAVGGVVNFILKDDFTGFDFDAQIGTSERGDGTEYRVSTLVGANLDDDRGNVMLGVEHYNRESVDTLDLPWYRELARDPNIDGTEYFLSQNYISFPGGTAGSPSQASYNSLFGGKGAPAGVDIPLSTSVYLNENDSLFINTSARPNDVYTPLFYGYEGEIDGTEKKLLANGQLAENNTEQMLSSPQERWSFFAKGEYELTSNIRVISQAMFAKTRTRSLSLNTVAIGSFAVPIPHNDEIYGGNETWGIPSSVMPDGSTHPDYRSGGKYGLDCGPAGGCTNKEVFPVPNELALLLNSRTDPNGDFYANIVPSSIARRHTENNNMTFQVLTGFEGDIPGTDWTWDVTGSYGETVAKTDTYGFFSQDIFRTIVQSPNYGMNFEAVGNNLPPGGNRNGATATCATGISPFNASQVYSEDCGLAVRIDAQVENRIKQEIVEANLQGGLFDLPHGDLRFAVGAAIRTNSLRFHADSSSVEGSTFYETVNGIFPQGSTEGSITVREAYGELLIPILSGMPFAEAVNLELGYRKSDYSTIGTNTTYKINGEWAPVDWLRFRGGYQKASRAPNLGEVFTARTQTLEYGFDGDPCSRGSTVEPIGYGNYSANPDANPDAAQVEALCREMMGTDGAAQYYRDGRVYPTGQGGAFASSLSAGSDELREETAKTYTIGAVIASPFQNPWVSNLRLSADYYNVKLSDGISLQGLDAVYRQCFSPVFNSSYELNEACQRIQRDSGSGETQLVTVNYSNLGRVKTSGFDVQLDWAFNFRDAGINLPGLFSINSNFTYLLEFATTPDQFVIPLTDYAGTTGGGEVGTNAGSYRWKLFTRFNYSVGPLVLGLQWQHKPSIDHVTSVTTDNSTIAGAPSYNLFNFNARYAITDSVNLRFGVDNLFDKAPPLIAYDTSVVPGDGQTSGGRYDAGNYDVLGRRFYIGANLSF